ncbi:MULTISPECIES: S9 family peptidase [Acidiphilium]|uniref:Oligopeptidase B Serine peptidase. MEROPS family S09A n=1 Tax=Acidiphilium rubrum TaxID=526 RepID=A0A8G2CKT7_ACIRU|nr:MULTISPECIES: S9 family peptidase [Acidiphilium]SIQ84614.1 oligopeptidase B Serine peptidase. MEROPS family S09A [Acidiphilium rubrum]
MNDHVIPSLVPPVAVRQPKRIEQLGRVRTDDYAWMKDDNWQAVLRDPAVLRPDIRAHLLAENAYTAGVLAGTEDLQEELRAEMKARIKQDDASVPKPDGPFAYYRRYDPGAEHPIYVRTPRAGGAEAILLDADAQAKGHAYYRVIGARHSPDHAWFAYAEDAQGSEVYQVRVKSLATGALLPGVIESCSGDFAWSPCSRYLFWTFRDDNGRPTRIFRRAIGDSEDVLIYEEPDEGFFIGVEASASGGSIFITCGNQETSEIWRIPGDEPTAMPVVIEPRTPGLRYEVEDWADRLVIRTNADGAVDFKLVEAPFAAPGRAQWRDIVAHRPGRFIVSAMVLRDYLIRVERIEANNRIILRTRAGTETAIAVDEAAYVLSLDPGYEFDTATIGYIYSSPTTPRQWFDYDIPSGARTLRKSQEIPSGHDPARYETRRLTATAADGATIPVTVLLRRDTPTDGSAPVHLYGYGSYGFAIDPWFQPNILSLVDRGWIHVIAHIRGGTEKGWNWFLDGRGAKKMNSFTDFIAVADHLIAQGYTKPGRIVAHGGSAGGLLMGAVYNFRPDLWAGVIAAVPFVDVLNTISDDTLPLTPPEWPEWGNPLIDPVAYDTIAAYSPYDNIGPYAYPPLLATGGLSDPRVTYWEPAKFVAKLRDFTTGDAPIMLKIDMDAGHAGAAGRFDALKLMATNYAFAIWAIQR